MSTDKEQEWRGPKTLSLQLMRFAEAYFYATGKNRNFKWAAVQAGAKESSAAALGYKWSRYTVVQNYWKYLQEITIKEVIERRIRRYQDVMDELKEISEDSSIPLELQVKIKEIVAVNDRPAADAFNPVDDSKAKAVLGVNLDEPTTDTLTQIAESLKYFNMNGSSEGEGDS